MKFDETCLYQVNGGKGEFFLEKNNIIWILESFLHKYSIFSKKLVVTHTKKKQNWLTWIKPREKKTDNTNDLKKKQILKFTDSDVKISVTNRLQIKNRENK